MIFLNLNKALPLRFKGEGLIMLNQSDIFR